MKKYLVAIDFSPNAESAIRYAASLSAHEHVSLILINVVEPRIDMIDPMVASNNLLQIEIDSMKRRMERQVERLSKYLKENKLENIELSHKVVSGTISDTIKMEAEEMEVDAIICGTHGEDYHFLEKMIGTIAGGIMHKAPCPVLLVPLDYKFVEIDNVVFATDLHEADIENFTEVANVLSGHSYILRCVHVCKEQIELADEKLASFSKRMIDQSPTIQTLFYTEVSKNVEDIITEYAETYDAELIIMTKTKKNFWRQLFDHSSTKEITYRLHKPLLVLQEK